MGLTINEISKLLAPAKESKQGKYCDMGGTIHQGRTTAEAYGNFAGKAGTMRRSSSGRMVRKPDGSRKYIAGDTIRDSVAWYIVKR